jgi:hypothetical protein
MRRLLATLTLFCALTPSVALADGGKVIRDCTDDGRLQGKYTQRDLRDALSSLPSDIDEYTNCRDVIRRAAFGGAGSSGGGKGGSGGSSGSSGGSPGGEFGGFGDGGSAAAGPVDRDPAASASPAERAALAKARKDADGVRFSDGSIVRPGIVSSKRESADVPGPLVLAAILLAALALTAAAPTLRNRVLARRDA